MFNSMKTFLCNNIMKERRGFNTNLDEPDYADLGNKRLKYVSWVYSTNTPFDHFHDSLYDLGKKVEGDICSMI